MVNFLVYLNRCVFVMTKSMIFEKGRRIYHDFLIDGTHIEVVDSFKYLGITLFKKGNWFRIGFAPKNVLPNMLHMLCTISSQFSVQLHYLHRKNVACLIL